MCCRKSDRQCTTACCKGIEESGREHASELHCLLVSCFSENHGVAAPAVTSHSLLSNGRRPTANSTLLPPTHVSQASNVQSAIPSMAAMNAAARQTALPPSRPITLSSAASSLVSSHATSSLYSKPAATASSHVPQHLGASAHAPSSLSAYSSSMTVSAPLDSSSSTHVPPSFLSGNFTASALSTFVAQQSQPKALSAEQQQQQLQQQQQQLKVQVPSYQQSAPELSVAQPQAAARDNVHMASASPVPSPIELESPPAEQAHTVAPIVLTGMDADCPVEVAAEPLPAASQADTVVVAFIDNTCSAMDLCSSPPPEQEHDDEFSSVVAPLALSEAAATPAPDSHLWGGDYQEEIINHWFETELSHHPRSDYMREQPDLNSKMREILVDWLHEVVGRFRLQNETLFLACNLLDRFLSLRAVHRKKLQLVGCVSLMLAAKFEEIYIPEIKDFLTISDNAYARDHVLHMEGVMLNTLKFELTTVSPLRFLQHFMNLPTVAWMVPATAEAECAQQLCMYLLELTVQCVDFLQFRPSTVAASVLYLARSHCAQVMQQQQPSQQAFSASFTWDACLERETRHTAKDLQPCVQMLYAQWAALNGPGAQALAASRTGAPQPAPVGGNKCLAIYRKYTKERHGMVSQIQLLRPMFTEDNNSE